MSDVKHKHYRPSEWIDPRIRLPELQQRYDGHFSPFLNERIRKLKEAGSATIHGGVHG